MHLKIRKRPSVTRTGGQLGVCESGRDGVRDLGVEFGFYFNPVERILSAEVTLSGFYYAKQKIRAVQGI